MILVVDASVTISWLAVDEQSDYASATLQAIGTDLALVPALWHWEIANTLLIFERRDRLPDAIAAFARVAQLPIEIEERRYSRDLRSVAELELARKHRLSAYDAAYLALAKATGHPVSTLDVALRTAARKEHIFFDA